MTKTKAQPVSNQHHLDFGSPDFEPDTFVPSAQNSVAMTALKTWQTWPGGVFCLCGEARSGKSHLGAMWAQNSGAVAASGRDVTLAWVAALTEQPVLIAVIDGADQCDETSLFTLLTALERRGGGVLLIATTPPSLWPYQLPDLKSRLAAIAFETMKAPEPELLASLIIRYAKAAGFRIDAATSQFMSTRIPRTFASARDIVVCMQGIDRSTLKSPKALAQRALHALYTHDDYEENASTPDLFSDLFDA
jgi:chromosomal replication initiation ATPase DnaA